MASMPRPTPPHLDPRGAAGKPAALLRAALLRAALFTAAALTACGGPELQAGTAGAHRQPIVGGVALLDGGHPAVFMLRAEFDNGTRAGCSATLISPRTLLTAAHCLDPRKAGATSVQLAAHGAAVVPSPTDPGWVPVGQPRFHPLFVPGDLFSYDIGAVLLPSPPPVAPVPFNAQDVSSLVGQPLTAVGYGVASEGASDMGTRRAATLTFRGVTAKHVVLGDQADAGICDGDSGGPSLHQFPDGVVRVVGVHSYKQPQGLCHDGLDTRVDLFAAFVRQYVSDHEGPTCVEDGLCKPGCAPLDPDCPPPVSPPISLTALGPELGAAEKNATAAACSSAGAGAALGPAAAVALAFALARRRAARGAARR